MNVHDQLAWLQCISFKFITFFKILFLRTSIQIEMQNYSNDVTKNNSITSLVQKV